MSTRPDPLTDPLYQSLFRIFSYFADLCPSGSLTPNQAHFILSELQRVSNSPTTSRQFLFSCDCVNFRELLTYTELLFPDRHQLEPCVRRLFERLIQQILKKGFVLYRKRGSGCNPLAKKGLAWKSAWITVTPGVVHIWPLHRNGHMSTRKSIVLDRAAKVECCANEKDHFLFELDSSKDHITIGHLDEIERNEFVTAIRLSLTHRTKGELADFDRRKAARNDGRSVDKDTAWRLALETENNRLSRLLDDERRALKDEEIVRSLATRMLAEERDRNEHVENQMKELQEKLMRQSIVPNNESTTVTVDLERIEEEGTDEVEVIERGDEEIEESEERYDEGEDGQLPFTPSFLSDESPMEPNEEEHAKWLHEQYLITSTQSI